MIHINIKGKSFGIILNAIEHKRLVKDFDEI